MKFSSKVKKEILIVFAISIIGITVASALFIFKPVAEKQPVADVVALAEFVRVKKQPRSLIVLSQGSVNAKTHISLVAEVSGRVTHMAQLKSNGGFFKKGDLLLNIDDTDYLLASVRARAQVAAAKQQLLKVEIEAGQAKYDLEQIGRNPSKSTAYALRKPHLAEAQANLQAAQADLKIAQLKMQRTRVKAPFDGRVVSKFVDIGQYVGIGTVLADIYSTDAAQVRLPLSLYQIELLGIALYDRPSQLQTVDVKLISEYFSSRHVWRAKLSHMEGVLNERNRLVFVVVEVESPYERDPAYLDRPSLTPGMFIKAELTGEVKDDVVKLPRASLRLANEVWVIDEKERLLKKHIVLYTKDEHFIYVKSGLQQGDRVIINAIDYPIEGMKLHPADAERTTISPAASTLSSQLDTTQKVSYE